MKNIQAVMALSETIFLREFWLRHGIAQASLALLT